MLPDITTVTPGDLARLRAELADTRAALETTEARAERMARLCRAVGAERRAAKALDASTDDATWSRYVMACAETAAALAALEGGEDA